MSGDLFFNDVWRMDWGFQNPNRTGAFIASLMMAVWILPYIWKHGFLIATIVFTVLGVCLIHTFSRGAFTAVIAAGVLLAALSPRPWPRLRLLAVTTSLLILLASCVFLGAHVRYFQSMIKEDRSIANRLLIWRVAPQMLRDAPFGWGIGRSGDAYMQWYQSLDRAESYRTLVNTHLTWLVELGIPLGHLYLSVWLCYGVLCWPPKSHRWIAVSLSVGVAFFLSACFSSVGESFAVWAIPIVALLSVLVFRCRSRIWPVQWIWIFPPLLAALAVATCYVVASSDSNISANSINTTVNGTSPKIVVLVRTRSFGAHYGKIVRSVLAEEAWSATVCCVKRAEDIRDLDDCVLVLPSDLSNSEKAHLSQIIHATKYVVLFNPEFFPEQIGITDSMKDRVFTIFGEFSRRQFYSNWERVSEPQIVKGAKDFFPSWLRWIRSIVSVKTRNGEAPPAAHTDAKDHRINRNFTVFSANVGYRQ